MLFADVLASQEVNVIVCFKASIFSSFDFARNDVDIAMLSGAAGL